MSKLPVPRPPPSSTPRAWLNSPPLSGQDLAGKVVVYDFWTYSCVNCVRTLPYLRAWHERYRQDGLVVVGVHSPEFDFEKDHGNVESAVARLKVTWPVALDDEESTWYCVTSTTATGRRSGSPTARVVSATSTPARATTPRPRT